MKKKSARLFAMLLCCLLLSSCGDNYGKILADTWKRVFDLSGNYQWSGYPVDNFGVGTAYDPPKGKQWSDGDRLCASWTCIGVKPESIPTDLEVRLTLNGFADKGSGGSVTLSEKQKKELGLNLLLPGLANVLNLTAKLDWSKGVNIDFSFGKAYKRSLIRKRMTDLINHLPATDPMKGAFDRGILVMITADLVVDSMHATIEVDTKLNPEVEAKLKGKAEELLGSGASAGFKFNRTTTGKYTLDITQPVVLAVLPRTQPAPGVLRAFTDAEKEKWDDWNLIKAQNQRPANSAAPKGLLQLK